MAAVAILFALACSRTTEPELGSEDGRVVLRFEPSPPSGMATSAVPRDRGTAAVFDSVIVRVFRPGNPIVQEKWAGAPVGVDPVEVSLTCVAENDKRISVEFFYSGLLTYHGANVDVDVAGGANTAVTVDVSKFYVENFTVTPGIVNEPTPFNLAWASAPAAAWYHVQASAQPNFAIIEWEENVTDTVTTAALGPGMHYIRVIPMTLFAAGLRTGPQAGYVTGGSNAVSITGFSVPAAIPGDLITIFGENLDFPGTQAWIGSMEMQIVSSSWGALDVRLPRAAYTETISVSSLLGVDSEPFVVQRVAYVTNGGTFAPGYVTALEKYDEDFGFSGVAVLSVVDLDTRDMSVFDIIIVAHDTGTSLNNWGGGVPARANAIANTSANVLAMGRGGALFLHLTGATSAPHQTATDPDGDYFAPDGSEQVFTTPHSVGGGAINFTTGNNAATTDFSIASSAVPAGVNLYASTDCARSLGLCVLNQPNDRWALADFRFLNPSSNPVVYCFWGYADDPDNLSKEGTDCLANIMNMLYRDRPLPPVD